MKMPTRITMNPFVAEQNGQPITRPATCECGAEFTQSHLSERFLSLCEAVRGGSPLDLVRQQIPGFWIPVFCPRCERHELGRQARVDAYRDEPRDWKEAAA